MNIPPKYEDVVAELEAALGREAALREELEMFVKAQLGISISEPGESFVQTTLRVFRMSKRRAAEFGFPEGENLEADIEAFEDYDALQQRLTVAEQRSGLLEGLLEGSLESVRLDLERVESRKAETYLVALIASIESALKPAKEGEGS